MAKQKLYFVFLKNLSKKVTAYVSNQFSIVVGQAPSKILSGTHHKIPVYDIYSTYLY